MKFPNQASSISFLSKGPTVGLLSVSDIPEEKPAAAAAAAATESEAVQGDEVIIHRLLLESVQTIQLLQIMRMEMRTKMQVLICL